jgi:phosphate transport system substrate-binding protein
MRKGLTLAVLTVLLWGGPLAAQNKLMIGGAGSMIPLMQTLAKGNQGKNAADVIEIMPASLGSGGGIKATEAGRLGIGLTGRPLKPEERGKLVYRSLGVMPVVLAVHAEVAVTGLSQAQVCAIYSGKVHSWKELGGPDVKIVALTRNEDDSDKEALRQHMACYRDLKESADVVVLTKGSDLTTALATRPGTIGLTTLGSVLKGQGRFKAVALDGVAPSLESARGGTYKMVKEFAVVTSGEPAGVAKRFLEFAAGNEGQQIMTEAGLAPRR